MCRFASVVSLGLGLVVLLTPLTQASDPLGHWRVTGNPLNWPVRILELEVRIATSSGDPIAIAYEADPAATGRRVWGSGKVERPRFSLPNGLEGWSSVDFLTPSQSITVLFRVEGELLTGVLRERPRDRSTGLSDKVCEFTARRELRNDETKPIRPRPPAPATPYRGELSGVFVAGMDGTVLGAVSLPDGCYVRTGQPAWSSDGKWLAFTSFDPSGRDPLIRIVPSEGGPSIVVAAGVGPTWSFDGSKIAYMASGRSVEGVDWNNPGRNDERIESVNIKGPKAGEVNVLARGIWPKYAPTDDRLAFVGRREQNWDIYVRSADGLGLKRLTDDPALDTQPNWSRTTGQVLFLSDRGNRWDLYTVPADGHGAVARLTNGRRREDDASPSPDGGSIAFSGTKGRPEGSIFVLDLGSGIVKPLLDSPDGEREPAWSPDGKQIAFISRRPGPALAPAGPAVVPAASAQPLK